MLMNGRFSTSAFTMAGVMCGSAARSFSAATFGSRRPLPTWAPTGAATNAAITAAATTATNVCLFIMSLLHGLDAERLLLERRMPVCVDQSNQPPLQHDARREHGRRLGADRLLEDRP